jgi:uncharacterized protein
VTSRAASQLAAGLAGALFGAGILISGMIDPANVLAFLDVAGDWDPRLAFVMGGAVTANLLALRVIRRRSSPLFDAAFHEPGRRGIDRRLVAGAAAFGIGWGLAGLCPGPSIVALASGSTGALAFFAAMLAGMHLHDRTAS